MNDNIIIDSLKDLQNSIEKSFEEIDKKIKAYNKGDKKQKNLTKKYILKELELIKKNNNQIKLDSESISRESIKEEWVKIHNKYKSKIKEYKEKINDLESAQANIGEGQEQEDDYKDPDAKVNLDELNVEQAMKRGDEILNADENALNNMGKVVHEDVDIMKDANKELERQKEQLDVADTDLKEMEFSIERARKKITNIFKLYASDKCITCLIVVILIIIITIIIVSACGGDNKNNFNVPHDIFGSNENGKNNTNTNSNSTTNDSIYLIKSFNLMNVIAFITLYLI